MILVKYNQNDLLYNELSMLSELPCFRCLCNNIYLEICFTIQLVFLIKLFAYPITNTMIILYTYVFEVILSLSPPNLNWFLAFKEIFQNSS